MSYYFSKTAEGSFEDICQRTAEVLKIEGFGVLTEIDVEQTLKKKLDLKFLFWHYLFLVLFLWPCLFWQECCRSSALQKSKLIYGFIRIMY